MFKFEEELKEATKSLFKGQSFVEFSKEVEDSKEYKRYQELVSLKITFYREKHLNSIN